MQLKVATRDGGYLVVFGSEEIKPESIPFDGRSGDAPFHDRMKALKVSKDDVARALDGESVPCVYVAP